MAGSKDGKDIKHIVEQTLLYDFYGELLTEHQKNIYEDVVLNDMSLSEIADSYAISRQAVSDLMKRINKLLEGYESKLHLVAKFTSAKEKVRQIRTETEYLSGLAERIKEEQYDIVEAADSKENKATSCDASDTALEQLTARLRRMTKISDSILEDF